MTYLLLLIVMLCTVNLLVNLRNLSCCRIIGEKLGFIKTAAEIRAEMFQNLWKNRKK